MAHKNENPTPLEEANEEKAEAALPSAFTLFKPSFDAVMINTWTFLGLLLAPFIAFAVGNVSGTLAGSYDTPSGPAVLLLMVAYAFSLVVYPAIPYVQLKSAQGEEVPIGEALRVGLKNFWRYYGVTLLSALVIFVGFLLLIVPGLFMLRRYMLAPYYLYDRKLGVIDAMKTSAKESKQFSGAIWGLIGVTILLALPSVIPFLGWLVTGALAVIFYCAPALRYFQIKQAAKKA
jgi:uncharacterized membrane protein